MRTARETVHWAAIGFAVAAALAPWERLWRALHRPLWGRGRPWWQRVLAGVAAALIVTLLADRMERHAERLRPP